MRFPQSVYFRLRACRWRSNVCESGKILPKFNRYHPPALHDFQTVYSSPKAHRYGASAGSVQEICFQTGPYLKLNILSYSRIRGDHCTRGLT